MDPASSRVRAAVVCVFRLFMVMRHLEGVCLSSSGRYTAHERDGIRVTACSCSIIPVALG